VGVTQYNHFKIRVNSLILWSSIFCSSGSILARSQANPAQRVSHTEIDLAHANSNKFVLDVI
jgi:hypothetical protein